MIPLSSIHARGSRYLLGGYTTAINPANYIKAGAERNSIFSLVVKASALLRENRQLEFISEDSKCSPRNREAYLNHVASNSRILESYISQLERDFTNEGDMPIDAIAGFLALTAGRGTVTSDYVNANLKDTILAKLEYASLQGLVEIAESLVALKYEPSSALWKAVHEALTKKLEVEYDYQVQQRSLYRGVRSQQHGILRCRL